MRLVERHIVASFTDAWIETWQDKRTEGYDMSHLLQMRGLKPCRSMIMELIIVASFTDAWIETQGKQRNNQHLLSHLLQMRGLKLASSNQYKVATEVASFTDAWIETVEPRSAEATPISRIFYRCVD